MKTEKKSPKKRSKVVVVIIIIFITLYIPSFFHWIYGDKIQTAILTNGSVEETIEADGIIIRDEEVIKSPFTGRCVINVAQGEKAASGEAIATLLKDSSVGALEDLRKKDLEILKTKNEKAKAQEIFSEDITKVENKISDRLKLLILSDNIGNSDTTWFIRQEIDKLIAQKADILGGAGGTDAKIQELTKERNQLQQVVNSYTKQIYSPTSGIISYAVDGLEGSLGIEKIQKMTLEQFKSYKPAIKEIKGNAISVEQDKPLCKVIKGLEQYIVIELPGNKSSDFEVDKTVKQLRLSETGKVYEGVVSNVSEPTDGKCLVAFRLDRGINETVSYRKVSIEIIKKASTGLKVEKKSLFDFDEINGTAKLMLVRANYSICREVEVIESNEEYAIIAPTKDPSKPGISLYDNYLVNPQNIREGQLIEK